MTDSMAGLQGPASVDSGRSFWNASSGRYAGEQLFRAMQAGRPFSPAALRTNATLRRDEWIHFDEQVIEEGVIRLQGIADLMALGLTIPIPNAMARTVYEYEKQTDMDPATVSMDGMTRSENDRPEYLPAQTPLPIIHKDFFMNLRTLSASRMRGEGLDATASRIAARKVYEEQERMLFQGGKSFGGLPIYGYTTHPNRNTVGFGTNGAWGQAAKTGQNIIDDALTMMGLLEGDRFYGPYGLYLPRNASTKIENDFKLESEASIRTRLSKINKISRIEIVDQLPANNVVMVQLTPDVVALLDGEGPQTIMWDVHGGLGLNFKVMAIQIPLLRVDSSGRSGVVHMS